jgi:hypothetical protein
MSFPEMELQLEDVEPYEQQSADLSAEDLSAEDLSAEESATGFSHQFTPTPAPVLLGTTLSSSEFNAGISVT